MMHVTRRPVAQLMHEDENTEEIDATEERAVKKRMATRTSLSGVQLSSSRQ